MMSLEENALKWGEDLFLHYMKNSREITENELVEKELTEKD